MPIKASIRPVLYVNGLGNGETRLYERLAFKRLASQGFTPEHSHVNWRADEPLRALINRQTDMAMDFMKRAGRISLVGVSAGGSLQLNVYDNLLRHGADPRKIQVVTIASWLQGGAQNDPGWDYRTLAEAAYFDRPEASQLFYDSVGYCQNLVLPNLSPKQLHSVTKLVPWDGDRIVPEPAMDTPQTEVPIQTYSVASYGHLMTCAVGLATVGQHLK